MPVLLKISIAITAPSITRPIVTNSSLIRLNSFQNVRALSGFSRPGVFLLKL